MNYDGADPRPPRWMLVLGLAVVAGVTFGLLFAPVMIREVIR